MLNYTLRNVPYNLLPAEQDLLQSNPPNVKEDWNHSRYNAYKQNIKSHLIFYQFDRCAYCRKRLEADGKYEPLEHIVAQTSKVEWIFLVKNLMLTCDSCNNLKNDEEILTEAYKDSKNLPELSEAYKIFNPHFDLWNEHLVFEDNIFITAVPNSKGKATIQICKLYRYNVILNRAKEMKLGQKTPGKLIMHRLNSLGFNDPESLLLRNQFQLALNHFFDRMTDDPRFD